MAALPRAERKFKRVKGYRETQRLISALQQKILREKTFHPFLKGHSNLEGFGKEIFENNEEIAIEKA